MILVLTGKSGSGKSTIKDILCRDMGCKKIITYTSRPKRKGETENDYHFVTDEKFFNMMKHKEFTEVKSYHPATGGTWWYGSKITDDQINSPDIYIIILTPAGYKDIRRIVPNDRMKCVYLHCTTTILEQRLYNRGDLPEEIVRRLNADASDFKGMLDSADKTILCSKMKPEDIASVIISFMTENSKSTVKNA